MIQLKSVTDRVLKQYFRDRGAIFFSLLSMLIVIGLMVFFLGDMSIKGLTELFSQFPNRDALLDQNNAERIVLVWACAGILSINAVTVTLAVYSIMIRDKATGKLNSFYTAPVNRGIIVGGYVLAAWVASCIICILTLALTEIYCVIKGISAFGMLTHIKLLGMIMVNSFTYAAIMYVAAALAKTEGAWSGIGTVVGTLVGFLGGIYIPVGSLASSIVTGMKCTPILYGTAMFRSVMMEEILKESFEGIPNAVLSQYRDVMGIDLAWGNHVMQLTEEWLILLGCGIVFVGLGIFTLKHAKKTDR